MNSNLDYLRPYTPIIVNIQGEVSFSHISKMYEGEELAAANKRAQEHGGRPSNRPYCTLTLDNPRILNPETLPVDVVRIMQDRFKPSKTSNVVRYYATSKSSSLPPVAYSVYAGAELAGQGIADKLHPLEHELDTGLTVTVGARIFDTAAGVGVGIDYVMIDEPIRYYEPNALADALASQGVTYVAPDKKQNDSMPRQVQGRAAADNSAYTSYGYGSVPEDSVGAYPTGGEMPYDPNFYYEDRNTEPVSAAMRNTALRNSTDVNGTGQDAYGAQMQPQGNAGRGRQNVQGGAQTQGNRNAAGQNVYRAQMQPQGDRNESTQMSQAPASPMARMRVPGQSQGRTA